jgi:hypothetical protein
MALKSVQTRGGTLDYAAGIYDIFEPMLLFGQESEINSRPINLFWLSYLPCFTLDTVAPPD